MSTQDFLFNLCFSRGECYYFQYILLTESYLEEISKVYVLETHPYKV